MTGMERLKALVYGATSTNFVENRASMRDLVAKVEREFEDARRDAWEGGYAARMAEQLSGEEPDL